MPSYRGLGVAANEAPAKFYRSPSGLNTRMELDHLYQGLVNGHDFNTTFTRPSAPGVRLTIDPTSQVTTSGAITAMYSVTGSNVQSLSLRETLADGRSSPLALPIAPQWRRIARYSGEATAGVFPTFTPGFTLVFYNGNIAYRLERVLGGTNQTLRVRLDSDTGTPTRTALAGLRARISSTGAAGTFETVDLSRGGIIGSTTGGVSVVAFATSLNFGVGASIVVDIERAGNAIALPGAISGSFTADNEHNYSCRYSPSEGTIRLEPINSAFPADPHDLVGYRLINFGPGNTDIQTYALDQLTVDELGRLAGNVGFTYSVTGRTEEIRAPTATGLNRSGTVSVPAPSQDAVFTLTATNPEDTAHAVARFQKRVALTDVRITVAGYRPLTGVSAAANVEPLIQMNWTGKPIRAASLAIAGYPQLGDSNLLNNARSLGNDAYEADLAIVLPRGSTHQDVEFTLAVSGVDSANADTTVRARTSVPIAPRAGG